jgi:hypothetical protein
MAIAAFALVLAVPLWAQRGGGGHGGGFGGGGHAGGFGGGHFGGGGFGGGHFGGGGFAGHGFSGRPGVHAYSGRSGYAPGFSSLPPTFGFNHPPTGSFNHPPTSGFAPPTSPLVRQPYASNGFGRGDYGRGGFGRGGFGYGRRGFDRDRHHHGFGQNYPYWGWGGYGWGGWGYPYWGYFDPWWGLWDSQDNSSPDNSDYENNLATAERMNEDSLRQQQMLDQEQMNGDQDSYQGASNPYQSAYDQGYEAGQAQNQPNRYNEYANVRPPLDPERMQEAERSQTQTADSTMRQTVLVFRNQHKQDVENYAIVDNTLWDFAPQQTVKIPLSELDIPATIRANQERGVTFSVPDTDEDQ